MEATASRDVHGGAITERSEEEDVGIHLLRGGTLGGKWNLVKGIDDLISLPTPRLSTEWQ